MYRRKLKLKSKIANTRVQKRVEKINTMQKDSSLTWTITALGLKIFSLLFFGAIILFPFFFMISNALMSDTETLDKTQVHITPKDGLHWGNFSRAFADGYWAALLVTLMVTAASIVLKLLLTMMMGYGFAYKKWWGKKAVWYTLISLMMIPEIALLVGQYQLVTSLKMHVGNQVIIAMFLPFIAHIFSAFMFRNAFENIPDTIKESALIDGSSEFKYFWKIAVPMITPTIWTVVILTAFASWNSYMWPQLLTSGSVDTKHVLGTWLFTTGKVQFGTQEYLLISVRLAAAILVTLPLFITYFLFRKRIMNAIAKRGSTVKG